MECKRFRRDKATLGKKIFKFILDESLTSCVELSLQIRMLPTRQSHFGQNLPGIGFPNRSCSLGHNSSSCPEYRAKVGRGAPQVCKHFNGGEKAAGRDRLTAGRPVEMIYFSCCNTSCSDLIHTHPPPFPAGTAFLPLLGRTTLLLF